MGASKDDEYFRLMVSLRDGDHSDARFAREAALRGLARPESAGLRAAFLNSMQRVAVRSPAGLDLGSRSSYTPQWDRLCRHTERIVRGLLFHHTGVRLPQDYVALATMPGLLEGDPDAYKMALAFAQQVRQGKAPQFVGRRVVSYWWRLEPNDAAGSGWLISYYERTILLGITLPVRTYERAIARTDESLEEAAEGSPPIPPTV